MVWPEAGLALFVAGTGKGMDTLRSDVAAAVASRYVTGVQAFPDRPAESPEHAKALVVTVWAAWESGAFAADLTI